jgi:diguanylate cyclase (GGDEF)-like protein
MRHARLSIASKPPAKPEGLLATFDEATERFWNFASSSRHSERPERLVAGTLRYAKEVEQHIQTLNARIAQLESLASTDELTGLLNRRGFASVMQRNLLSAARYDEGGVLAYIDLDDFKGTNDRHGHQVGDMVLKNIGRYLRQNIRATDYAARLGGDEFTVLFVRADHAPACKRASHLVAGLNELTVSSSEGEISIRASLGIARYDSMTDMDDLLDRADKAMYIDKRKEKGAAQLSLHS